MIQFVGPDRRRRTVRLGKVPMKQAEAVRLRVEHLVAAGTTGAAPDGETAHWVPELDDTLHEKLAAVGLLQPRLSCPPGPYLDQYAAKRTDVKPSTLVV